MPFIFEHFWIVLIAVTVFNGFWLRLNSKPNIESNPDLKPGYRKLFYGWIFYGNVPWCIIGIGDITGMTSNIFEYLTPRTWNPIVLLFHASLLLLWILLIRWIYFKNGAEFLEKHPGLLKNRTFNGSDTLTAEQIKKQLLFVLIGSISAWIMMWLGFPFGYNR